MRKDIFKLIVLLMIAGGVQPAYAAFWQWAKTASNNANADPSISWAEGMSPSSVNDSGRAMMARAAEFRDDISGLLATTGTSTAYLVTTNQGLASTPNDGQQLAVTVNSTNGVSPTLAADGGTAYPIQSAPAVAVPSGTLISGSPYTLKFSVANSAWMLRNFYGTALSVPLGGLLPYTLTTVPNSNFVFPAGQCLSTTTYATYWVALGSPASGTCAGGQFRIIDLRGRVPAGLDTMPGFGAATRLTSSATGCGTAMTTVGASCANGSESKNFTIANLSAFVPTGTFSASLASGNVSVPQQGNSGVGSPVTTGFSEGANNKSPTVLNVSVTGNVTGPVSMNSLGSGTAAPTVDPNVAVTYLLRVL